jgi:hypothetical protein
MTDQLLSRVMTLPLALRLTLLLAELLLIYHVLVTGKVYHLVINQAVHIPHLDHHLLCPMQC